MDKPDRSGYTAVDFLDWRTRGILKIQPKFQRREVWTTPKKSYLIDTILKQMPVPPIFLRNTQSEDGTKVVREVIDGQQRICAVLDFLEGKYALAKPEAARHGAARFEKLPREKQDLIRRYSFVCEVFQAISDADVLEVFARVNTYSVPLNRQELLNGKYFGFFKQCAYALAHEHLEFWRRNKIFNEAAIARMVEVELTSELMILLTDGLQHKKDTIQLFYEMYDEDYGAQAQVEKRFRETIDAITAILGDELQKTEFRRPPFFYTLFAATAHRLFGIDIPKIPTKKGALTRGEIQSARDALLRVSEIISEGKSGIVNEEKLQKFVDASLKSTDKLEQRLIRFVFVYNRAFGK